MPANFAALALALALQSISPAADVPLTGTPVTVHERSGDPMRLSSYGFGTSSTYLRKYGHARFVRRPSASEIVVSPNGRRAAAVSRAYRDGYDSMFLINRATGKSRRIKTVKMPLTASYAAWSRDGSKVVLTVEQPVGGGWRTLGFVLVDVATGTRRRVDTVGVPRGASFWFSPDGHLVTEQGSGLRFYRQNGTISRTYPRLGVIAGAGDSFSPSGRRLVMWCPPKVKAQVCVADPATGKIVTETKVVPEGLFGWWDEDHVIAVVARKGAYRLVVTDFNGVVTRVLADVPYRTWAASIWFSFTRAQR